MFLHPLFLDLNLLSSQMTLKNKILAFSLAAAILIPTGAFALNNSYFSQSNVNLNDLVDNQVKQAATEGLTIPIDYKISDQGVTISFHRDVCRRFQGTSALPSRKG